MSNINFKYCPICGGDLETGKMQLPSERTIYSTEYVWYYSDETIENCKSHPVRSLFKKHDKVTAVKKKLCVPAGYCEKCDRIFAEFEIRDSDNPIGEDEI